MLHDSFGLELFNASQYSDALVEFSTALGYNGRVVQIYLHRARTAQKLGKLERAYKDYLEVLRLDGTRREFHLTLVTNEPRNQGLKNHLE